MQTQFGVKFSSAVQRFGADPGTRTYTQDACRLIWNNKETTLRNQLWALSNDEFKRAHEQAKDEKNLSGGVPATDDGRLGKLLNIFTEYAPYKN